MPLALVEVCEYFRELVTTRKRRLLMKGQAPERIQSPVVGPFSSPLRCARKAAHHAVNQLIDFRRAQLPAERRHASVSPVGHCIDQIPVILGRLPCGIGEIGRAHSRHSFSIRAMAHRTPLLEGDVHLAALWNHLYRRRSLRVRGHRRASRPGNDGDMGRLCSRDP